RLLLLLEIRYDAAPGAPLYLLSLHDALPIFFDDGADCAVDALTAQWAARNTPQGETWTGVWDPDAFAALREYVRAELGDALDDRSAEHTSELQSREKLVCRLVLEKKDPSTLI